MKRAKIIHGLVADKNKIDLAIGYLRYEALRKLNRSQLCHLLDRNMQGIPFDALVDELIEKDGK